MIPTVQMADFRWLVSTVRKKVCVTFWQAMAIDPLNGHRKAWYFGRRCA